MFKKKSAALLVSLILVLCIAAGGTVAYLFEITPAVENTFSPATVTTTVDEGTEDGVKTNVKITNTGNTGAYIRAAVVITWQNANGDIYGKAPVLNTDYTISYDLANGWTKSSDGFYYWNSPVAPGASTGVLITQCMPTAQNSAPEGYSLAVEIVGSGIQSIPTRVVTSQWSSGVSGVSGTTLQIKN